MSECKQKYIEWSSKDGLYCGEHSDGLLVGQLVGTEARLEFGGWEACWNARQEEIDELKAQLEVKHSAPSQKTHFEDMIRQSPDFATLLNIHGERLFIKHELSYAVLAMRSAYWAWLWVHTLYKDISEMCDEIVADAGDVGAEIKKLKAEKAGLEKKLKSVYDFEALFEIEKRCNGRLQDRIKKGIRIMDCNERYIPLLAMQSIKKALRGGHE